MQHVLYLYKVFGPGYSHLRSSLNRANIFTFVCVSNVTFQSLSCLVGQWNLTENIRMKYFHASTMNIFHIAKRWNFISQMGVITTVEKLRLKQKRRWKFLHNSSNWTQMAVMAEWPVQSLYSTATIQLMAFIQTLPEDYKIAAMVITVTIDKRKVQFISTNV